MSSEKSLKGSRGEQFTAEWLAERGYLILERNYHSRWGEIDIIAEKDDVLAFVEVKLRRNAAMVSGREAVTPSKMRKLTRTALMYLAEHPTDAQPRFDVAEVWERSDGLCMDYLENAFEAAE